MVWLLSGLGGLLLVIATTVGAHSQVWSPWWFTSGHVGAIQIGPPVSPGVPESPGAIVSDAQRYALAVQAGFNGQDAITAVAISIAEDGSGDPAALSGVNRDGSRDLGLWQINSGWWPQFGGHDALVIPINNAHAALVIFGRQGWCAWSTYLASCGIGHTGSYAANLGRARAAAGTQP